MANGASVRRTQSDSALAKPPSEVKDAYAHIKENMKPFVEKQGKPRIRAIGVGEPAAVSRRLMAQPGERLTFFNTLQNKYHMKVRD